MKKVIALLMAAAFVLSLAGTASAVHEGRANLQTTGFIQTAAGYADGTNFEENGGSTFYAEQRLRQYWDYVASDNLKATVGYEIDATWGSNVSGAGENFNAPVGADATDGIAIKRANMEFTLPGTEATVKSGIQFISLPNVAMGYNPVLAGDMAGITVSTPVTDVADLTFGWTRGYDNTGSNAAPGLDTFFATMPIMQDGFNMSPFVAYSAIGQDVDNAALDVPSYRGFKTVNQNTPLQDSADAYWVGSNFNLNMMDPVGIMGSFIYGSLNTDQDVNERAGWYADLQASYKMENMTPEVYFSYASGDDDDPSDGSETMPMIFNDGLTSKSPSMLIGDMTSLGINTPGAFLLQGTPLGLWQVGVSLTEIQVTEKMLSTLTAAYYQGTSEEGSNIGIGSGFSPSASPNALTEDDSAFDITLSNTYSIYENLSAICEAGYAKLDLDSGDKDEPAYRLGAGLNYSF